MASRAEQRSRVARVAVSGGLGLATALALAAAGGYAPKPAGPVAWAVLTGAGRPAFILIVIGLTALAGITVWRVRRQAPPVAVSAEEPLLPRPHLPSVMGLCPVIGLLDLEPGAGSSTLAFNLAVTVTVDGHLPANAARSGRPRAHCILAEGPLSKSLGVDSGRLHDYMERHVARVADDVVDLALRHPSGVELLSVTPGRMNVEQLRRLVQVLRRHYDSVLLDCPRGDPWLEEAVTQLVDVLLLVALSTGLSAEASRTWAERAWRQGAEHRVAITINRQAATGWGEGMTNGFVHAVHLPDDRAVADFDIAGPPWALDPRIATTRQLRLLALALIPHFFDEENPRAA
jgi:hypothetical protein